MKKIIKKLVLLIFLFQTSCASVIARIQSYDGQPRNDHQVGRIDLNRYWGLVSINGVPCNIDYCQLSIDRPLNEHIIIELLPGKYTIEFSNEFKPQHPIEVYIAAGHFYYPRFTNEMALSGGVILRDYSPDEQKKLLWLDDINRAPSIRIE